MSEFEVVVGTLGPFGKHPDADSLSITQVKGSYPVIFRTEDFPAHSKIVHIPPDAIVDTKRPEFSWLADKARADGTFTVKAIKMRGRPSHGFFIPAPAGVPVGTNVQDLLGITKHIDDGAEKGTSINDRVPYYDIESVRKYAHEIPEGTTVVVTEKINGMNGRWTILGGKLVCCSRKQAKENSVWNLMAEKYKLEWVLSNNPGIILYGEVYGQGVQDLTYGIEDKQCVFFDVYDGRRWWTPAEVSNLCIGYGLPQAPTVYTGPYSEKLAYELAEGPSILHALNAGFDLDTASDVPKAHCREGVVIKPVENMYSHALGRVFLKLVGEGYLLRGETRVERSDEDHGVEMA